jgi:PAS domain S-box-containing protein
MAWEGAEDGDATRATRVVVIAPDEEDRRALAAALAAERPLVFGNVEAAADAILAGAVALGVAPASLFSSEALVARLQGMPWLVVTASVEEELSLLRSHPDLDARCVTRDAAGRWLDILPLRVRGTSGRERLLATLTTSFPAMVAYWDQDERCRYANAAYRTWFARTPSEMLGITMRDLLGPLYPMNVPHIRGALEGVPQRFERTVPGVRGGATRQSLVTYTPDVHEGRVRGFVAFGSDISEQHRLQEQLAERDRRWAALFDVLPVGVSVVNEYADVLEANPALERIVRLSREDLAGGRYRARRCVDASGEPLDAADFPSARALATRRPAGPVELGIVTESAGTIWTEVVAAPFPDEAKAVVITRDLTAEKTSAARFEAIVDASPVPYALNDDQGRITYVNRAFVASFGWTLEDIPSLEAWWPKAYPDPTYRTAVADDWRERMERARRERTPFEPLELRLCTKDGASRVVICGAASLEGSFAGVHLVVLHDVTEQRAAEAMRLQLERQRLDAQKLTSIGALAAGIAHDFNNILAPILSHAELALQGLEGESPLRSHLGNILLGATRAAGLVRQILDVSRPSGRDARTQVDVGALVLEVEQLIRASVPANIAIETCVAPDRPLVLADHGRIHQVVLNLVTNARDAMTPAGGRLMISVEALDEAWLELVVGDTGPGMTPEVAERAFEPYFTTKRGAATKGTGLGLATVQAIVTRLGGTIALETTPGQGTRARVRFPNVISAGSAAPPAPADVTPIRTPPKRVKDTPVLVVDDEHAVAGAVALVLKRLGYAPLVAHSAREALAVLDSGVAVAAVLTDLTMPEMNGITLTAEVHARRAIPVLLMTGYGDAAEDALACGVTRVLEKPCSIAQLGSALDEALASSDAGTA